MGVYGASGAPERGRRRRARQEAPSRVERALYIGNLGAGAVGQIYPLRPALDSETSPEEGHCMKLRWSFPRRVPLTQLE
jgi:hypothetical protein